MAVKKNKTTISCTTWSHPGMWLNHNNRVLSPLPHQNWAALRGLCFESPQPRSDQIKPHSSLPEPQGAAEERTIHVFGGGVGGGGGGGTTKGKVAGTSSAVYLTMSPLIFSPGWTSASRLLRLWSHFRQPANRQSGLGIKRGRTVPSSKRPRRHRHCFVQGQASIRRKGQEGGGGGLGEEGGGGREIATYTIWTRCVKRSGSPEEFAQKSPHLFDAEP